MLAILLSLFYCSGIRAQIFTSVPYNFPDNPLSNSNGFTDQNSNNISLTSTWTAANGYGIWNTDGSNWFLFSNELQNESSGSIATLSPSGVVAEGGLGYLPVSGDHDVKVATNLLGQVRYVWPDESIANQRSQFVVKGFNGADIHINFTGIPQTANSRNVIYTPIDASSIIHSPVPTGGTIVTSASTSNFVAGTGEKWQDCFDIAMDVRYLYIVWETFTVSQDGRNTRQYQIWATAQNLSTGVIEYGPRRIDDLANPGTGRRPTVDCDRRNSHLNQTFDVAYII
jgi:hypothetical protein